MSEYVVIRLSADDQPVEWVHVDSSGARRSGVSRGSIEQAAREAGQHPVMVLVPAEDVVTTTVNLPMRATAKIRAALPFALEEELADDVETLHFAIGIRQENGQIPVAVVANDKMQDWLARLAGAGIEPTSIIPCNQGLAKIPGTMSVVVDGPTVFFNDGSDAEFVLHGVAPSDALVIAGELGEQQEDDNPGHLMVFCTAEDDERLSHDWIALRHELHSVDINLLPDGVLPKLAVTVAAGHGVNLLQGVYGKKTEYAAMFRPWRLAASLLVGLFVVGMALKGVGYFQLLDDKAALQAQFSAEYQLIRPGDSGPIADPAAVVNSLRRSLSADSGPQIFIPSMRELSSALSANSSVEIEAINYRAGEISLRLLAPDVTALDEIQKAVAESGRFSASIERTDRVADKIDGRIKIRESGS